MFFQVLLIVLPELGGGAPPPKGVQLPPCPSISDGTGSIVVSDIVLSNDALINAVTVK